MLVSEQKAAGRGRQDSSPRLDFSSALGGGRRRTSRRLPQPPLFSGSSPSLSLPPSLPAEVSQCFPQPSARSGSLPSRALFPPR